MKNAVTRHGEFFYFDHDDIGNRIAKGEFFDAHLKPYMDNLGEGSVLVDVGANIGFFTVYAAKRGAKVHAFEASLPVFNMLQRNVTANYIQDRVRTYWVALYDSYKALELNPQWTDFVGEEGALEYDKMANSGGYSLVEVREAKSSKNYVVGTPLDNFYIARIDLLKVDAQGADLRILVGAKKTIDRCKPKICFEFEPGADGKNACGDALSDFEKYLESRHYHMTHIASGSTASDYLAVPQ